MYEQVFGFTARPFVSTPNVQNYFPAEAIHYGLSQTRLCVERSSGPAIITGSSGTGKSLLLAMLANQFESNFQVVQIFCSHLSQRKDLLQHILFELNMPYREMSEGELRLSLIDHLKTGDIGSGVLMLVDDAHTLPSDLLDELRSITNFVREGRNAISLVMAGASSLEGNLIDTKSESLNQRIAVRSFLANLGKKESMEYVLSQIERCGGNAESLFTGDALDQVHECSDGCPRVINQLCDYALVLTASQNANRVTKEIISDAWNDIQSISTGNVSVDPANHQNEMNTEAADDFITPSEDMVIEFGQLDDEPATSEPPSMDTTLEIVDDLPEEYRLQEEEVEVPVTSNSLEYVMVTNDVESQHVTETIETTEPVADFEDPFAETFEVEENVDPSYVPFISAQNINSLMVTNDQLALLELPLEANRSTSSLVVADRGSESTQLTVVDAEVAEPKPEGHIADSSPDGMNSLEEMQENVRRLQRELHFSQQDFSSEAVHPDFAVVAKDQPIEELLQEHTVVNQAASAQMEEVAEILDVAAKQDSEVSESIVEDDDRDIMIISQPEKFNASKREELEQEFADVRISTGVAHRMNYEDLFRQLRTAN